MSLALRTVILTFWVGCFAILNVNEARAIDLMTSVQEVGSGSERQLMDLLNVHRILKEKTRAKRRNYEDLSVFKKRKIKAESEFSDFLDKRYRIKFQPDGVNLDWENSTISLLAKFPVPVMRTRGGSVSSESLRVTVAAPPDVVREIQSFPTYLAAEAAFVFDEEGSMLIDYMEISYTGRQIYKEGTE